MKETKNYKLYLTDDSSEKFKEWREKMNGVENSNMTKIDTALSEKAKSSVVVYGTLLTSSWKGTSAPYTQAISVNELGSSQNGYISLANNATVKESIAASQADLTISSQSAGSLTISANGIKPKCNIPVVIVLLG